MRKWHASAGAKRRGLRPVGTDVDRAGKAGNYTDTLPGSLARERLGPSVYFVELRNRKGRSAGLSNAATVLAGEAPRPVEGLKAEMRKQGVVLSWTADGENAAVRLERTLLTASCGKSQRGLLAAPREPAKETLLVETRCGRGRAMTTRFALARAMSIVRNA